MKYSFRRFFVVVVMLSISACVHQPFAPVGPTGSTGTTGSTGVTGNTGATGFTCNTDTVYFTNTILPILQTSCAISKCHDSITHIEEFDLSSYNSLMASRLVVPGDTADSYLYYSVVTNNKELIMPPFPSSPLSSSQIASVATWILQGAKNNICTASTCDTTNVSYSATLQPILNAGCYSCHSTARAAAYGDSVDLQTFSSLQAYAKTGTLLCDINFGNGCNQMPPYGNGSQLSVCDIQMITSWINQGAPNN